MIFFHDFVSSTDMSVPKTIPLIRLSLRTSLGLIFTDNFCGFSTVCPRGGHPSIVVVLGGIRYVLVVAGLEGCELLRVVVGVEGCEVFMVCVILAVSEQPSWGVPGSQGQQLHTSQPLHTSLMPP